MTIHRHRLSAIALATGFALAVPGAFAQSFDAVRLYGAAPGKDGGTLGAALVSGYEYQGADERVTRVVPLLNYQWANGWFAGVSNGVGYNFSGSPEMQYGFRLTADKGRKESRSSALRGMGSIDAAAEAGAFFNYSLPDGVFLSSSIRYGAGTNHKGLVVDLGAGYLTEIAPKWHLGTGVSVTLANARYMQSFFGVSQAQAAATGYAAYTAGAGARDVRANVALSYLVDAKLSVTTAFLATRLLGDAQDSPVSRKRTSGSGVLGMNYAF
jgi:outer membrane scaffolding protein for murein synthesis (MipA/OmpV family)